MKKVLCLVVMLCVLLIGNGRAEEAKEEDCFTIGESVSSSPLETTTITFGADDYWYSIDAEGFRSLTPDEALRVAAAISMYNAGGWFPDSLSAAICEAFIPERFKNR